MKRNCASSLYMVSMWSRCKLEPNQSLRIFLKAVKPKCSRTFLVTELVSNEWFDTNCEKKYMDNIHFILKGGLAGSSARLLSNFLMASAISRLRYTSTCYGPIPSSIINSEDTIPYLQDNLNSVIEQSSCKRKPQIGPCKRETS